MVPTHIHSFILPDIDFTVLGQKTDDDFTGPINFSTTIPHNGKLLLLLTF